MSTALLVALFAGVIAVNLLVTWLLVRSERDLLDLIGGSEWQPDEDGASGLGPDASGNGAPDGDPPPLDAEDVVVCRHCGAENRPGYRYCRWCVRSGLVDGGRADDPDAMTTERPL